MKFIKKYSPQLLISLLVISFIVLFVPSMVKKTSQELIRLREIESGLNLPNPVTRSESDVGCRAIKKGSISHFYERYIFFNYETTGDVEQVVHILETKGWKLDKTSTSSDETTFYSYLNETQDAQIYLTKEPKSSTIFNSKPVHGSARIQALKEPTCSG